MRFSEMVFKSLFARIESMTSVYRASTSGDSDMSSKSFDFLFFTDPKLEKSELRFEKSLQVGSRVLIRVK
jgi:hypothetical protein